MFLELGVGSGCMILLTQVNSGWILNINYTGLTCSLENTHTEISFLNVNHFNGDPIGHWKMIMDTCHKVLIK